MSYFDCSLIAFYMSIIIFDIAAAFVILYYHQCIINLSERGFLQFVCKPLVLFIV